MTELRPSKGMFKVLKIDMDIEFELDYGQNISK